jgi:hypothetical protein
MFTAKFAKLAKKSRKNQDLLGSLGGKNIFSIKLAFFYINFVA